MRLRKELQKQWSGLDYMENQSRRQNIVFHNMPKKRQNVTWDDCERAMREVRQTENRCRHIAGSCPPCGSSIIIRLQNYKDKDLILKKRTQTQTTGHKNWNLCGLFPRRSRKTKRPPRHVEKLPTRQHRSSLGL